MEVVSGVLGEAPEFEGSVSGDGDSGWTASSVLEFVSAEGSGCMFPASSISVEVAWEEKSISISASGATEGDDCGKLNSFK